MIGYTRQEQREEEAWSARDERKLQEPSTDELHGDISIDPDWDKRDQDREDADYEIRAMQN